MALPQIVMVAALVLRLVSLGRSYDLVQDEVNYVDLGTSLRHGHFPPIFSDSGPFLLHPPLFFLLSAAWQAVLPAHAGYFELVTLIRGLNVALAAVSAGLLYVLGRQLGNRATGLAAGLLFALDPYVLRQNGRALLETCTITFVLLGYVVLLRVVQHRTAHAWWTAVAGGLLLGLGVVSKDLAIMLVVLPLAAMTVLGWGVDRRHSLTALVASVVPYGVYVGVLAFLGSFHAFFVQETAGLQRAVGQQKSTGFTKTGSPSLSHTLLAQFAGFGTTYTLLGLSALATLYLLLVSRRADQRLMAVVTGCGAVTVVYSVLFGTIEEQFLYFLLIPALLTLVVGITVFLQRRSSAVVRDGLTRGALVVLILFLGYDLGLWVHTRSTPDNGQQQIAQWFGRHAPHPGIIGTDTVVTAYALQRSGFAAGSMGTPAQAAAAHVLYLTVLPVETQGNYGSLSEAQERFYEQHGRRVFSFNEPTYGDEQIYRTTDPSLW